MTEPTEEVVAVAHKGFVAFEVETVGRAAHGSRPDLGIDAIAAMGPVLSGIAALDARLRSGAGHPLLGTGSVHASVIEGGQEYSSYPAGCLLKGERRTIPGETVELVRAELEEIADGTGATVRLPFHRGPFETATDAPVVAALHRHLGHDDVGGVAFWADSALLAAGRDPDRRLRAGRRRHPRRRRVGRPRLARALPRRVPRRRAGAVRVRRLRVVHVGVGLWGRSWAELIAGAPGYRLVGVADAGAAGRAWAEQELQVPAFRDLGRALRDAEPDVVVLASPPSTHRPLAELALAEGCHVIVEKPLALTLEDAVAIAAAADAAGRHAMVSQNYRFRRQSRALRDLVRSWRARARCSGSASRAGVTCATPGSRAATGAAGCPTRISWTWRSITSTCSA